MLHAASVSAAVSDRSSWITGNSEPTDGPILTSGLPTNRAELLHLVVDRGHPYARGGNEKAGLQGSGKSFDAGA